MWSGSDFAGMVAVLAGDVAIGVKSQVGSDRNPSDDVMLSAVAGVTSSADCVGGRPRPTMPRFFPWPLLRWRPRSTLLGRRPRLLLGGVLGRCWGGVLNRR